MKLLRKDVLGDIKIPPTGACDPIPPANATLSQLFNLVSWGRGWGSDGKLGPWEQVYYHPKLRDELKRLTPFV